MADYINRNILCQAYVHVRTEKPYGEAIRDIERTAIPLVRERAKFFLYDEAVVEFSPSEGSVKSRITVFGTLILALQGMSNYKDFREGIIILYDDVQRVADLAVTETLFALRERGAQIERVEVRVGVVGSLRRLIRQIESIRSEESVSYRQQAYRLEQVSEEISRIIDNLNDESDVDLVEKELLALISKIPKNPRPVPGRELTTSLIDNYRRKLRDLIRGVSASARSRVVTIRASRVAVAGGKQG